MGMEGFNFNHQKRYPRCQSLIECKTASILPSQRQTEQKGIDE